MKFLQAGCADSSGVVTGSPSDTCHITFSLDLQADGSKKRSCYTFYFSAPYLSSDIRMDIQLKKLVYSEFICAFGAF